MQPCAVAARTIACAVCQRGEVPVRREEVNEEVRLGVVGALGAWLGRLDAWPPSVLSRLVEGLGERDALRRAHLKAIVQVRMACTFSFALHRCLHTT